MQKRTLAVFLAGATGVASAQLDERTLEDLAKQVVPVVAKATGASLEGLKIKIATRGDLVDAVQRQVKALSIYADKKAAKAASRQAAGMSRLLLAKYDSNRFAVLICPRNFKFQAKMIKTPELDTLGAYRAVLVHECVHAADDRNHKWFDTLLKIKTEPELQAFHAVIEGHAQYVTAKICEQNGWSKGFEAFTSVIGKQPPDIDEAERAMSSIALANMYAAYHDGRSFTAAIAKELGEEKIGVIFRKPPKIFDEITNPAWYLDPSKRPKRLVDLDGPTDAFLKRFDTKKWVGRAVSATQPQLRAAFQLLPEDVTKRVLDNMRANKMAVVNDRRVPGSRMMVAGLYEFSSATEANHYVVAARRLIDIKKEKMAKGAIQIQSTRLVELKRDGWQGIYVEQVVSVRGQKVEVRTVVGSLGRTACEILYSNEKTTQEALIEHADTLLGQAAKKSQPTSRKVKRRAP